MRKHLTPKICVVSKTQLLFLEMYNRKHFIDQEDIIDGNFSIGIVFRLK
jgi:hypothetical protein